MLSQDSANGVWTITTGSDHTSTTYDRLGRVDPTTDQRGVVHTYTYDSAGRLSADDGRPSLRHVGHVDGSVLSHRHHLRRPGPGPNRHQLRRHAPGPRAVNQVEYAYDGWGNCARSTRPTTGCDTNTPYVQYDYADGATGGVAEYLRLTEVTYPNGRDVQYNYGRGAVDDIMSRLEFHQRQRPAR